MDKLMAMNAMCELIIEQLNKMQYTKAIDEIVDADELTHALQTAIYCVGLVNIKVKEGINR